MVNVVDVTGGQRGYGGGYPQQYARRSGPNVQIGGGAQDMSAMLQMLLEQQAMQQRANEFTVSQDNMLTMMREQQSGMMDRLTAAQDAQAAENNLNRQADWNRVNLLNDTTLKQMQKQFDELSAARSDDMTKFTRTMDDQKAATKAANDLALQNSRYSMAMGMGQLGLGLYQMLNDRRTGDKTNALAGLMYQLNNLNTQYSTAQDRHDVAWNRDFSGVQQDVAAVNQLVDLATSPEKSWDDSYADYASAVREIESLVKKYKAGSDRERAMLHDAGMVRSLKDTANRLARLSTDTGLLGGRTGKNRGVHLAADIDRVLKDVGEPISQEAYDKVRWVGRKPEYAATNDAIADLYNQKESGNLWDAVKSHFPTGDDLLRMTSSGFGVGSVQQGKPVSREDAGAINRLHNIDVSSASEDASSLAPAMKVMNNIVNGPASSVQKIEDINGKTSAVTDMTTPTVPVVSPMYDELFN